MRLMLVEDDAVLADGLSQSLCQAGYAVDWMGSGERVVPALKDGRHDVLILDLGLPGIDGFEVLRRVRQERPALPVLILTARADVADRVRGLNLGADDYLVKPFALTELEARVRALVRRAAGSASPQITYGSLVVDGVARRARVGSQPLELARREWSVLEVLVYNFGKIVSKERIVEAICSWDEDVSPNAVEVYVSRLRSKLEASGVRIRTIRGLGYLMEESAAQ